MERREKLMLAMTRYECGVPQRVQHFIKVHAFARLIGLSEGLDARTQEILETAALVHDIGIRPALEKYGDAAGPLQEKEGEAPARQMLTELGYDAALVERVCYLVAHHHTYAGAAGADYRILLEADYLVNAFEGGQSEDAIRAARGSFFETKTGKQLLDDMFALR